jgi:hypothetical protein
MPMASDEVRYNFPVWHFRTCGPVSLVGQLTTLTEVMFSIVERRYAEQLLQGAG